MKKLLTKIWQPLLYGFFLCIFYWISPYLAIFAIGFDYKITAKKVNGD